MARRSVEMRDGKQRHHSAGFQMLCYEAVSHASVAFDVALGHEVAESINGNAVNRKLPSLLLYAPRLYVLDGAKALSAGMKRHAGDGILIQRCQVHKRRNVLEHLPDEYQPGIERKLLAAYGMVEYADAKKTLVQIHRELDRINPSAARSLEEGMEETLTVHKLRMPEMLRKSLASTNIIESAFSVAEELCRRVKRWREGDHRERWAGSALLLAESKFRRVKGYKEIPKLLTALEEHGMKAMKKGLASKAKTA